MLAVFDDVVHNAPISIEKEYVDTNGHRDPQRILVKHNHVACSLDDLGQSVGAVSQLRRAHSASASAEL